MDECKTCGAETVVSFGDRLDAHLADYSDPHKTVRFIPKTYFGYSAPAEDSGYKTGDWYLDLVSGSGYVYSGSSWVEAFRRTVEADLSGLATKGELEAYATKSELGSYATVSMLSDYVLRGSFDAGLQGKVSLTELPTLVEAAGFAKGSMLSSYVQKSEFIGQLSSYAKASALTDYLKSADAAAVYATKAEVTEGLAGKVSTSDVDGDFFDDRGGISKTTADSTYATKSELARGLDGKLSLSEITEDWFDISGGISLTTAERLYARKEALDNGLRGCAKVDDLSSFLTKDDADLLYLPRGFEGGTGVRSLEYASVVGAGANKYGYAWYESIEIKQFGVDSSGGPILGPASYSYTGYTVKDLSSKLSAGDRFLCIVIDLSAHCDKDIIYTFEDAVKSSKNYIGHPDDKFTLIVLLPYGDTFNSSYRGTTVSWQVHLDFSTLSQYAGKDIIYASVNHPFDPPLLGSYTDELYTCGKLADLDLPASGLACKLTMTTTITDPNYYETSIESISAPPIQRARLIESLNSVYYSTYENPGV